MTTDCIIEDARWDSIAMSELAEAAVHATLTAHGLDAAAFEVSVLACDDARITTLNADFRDKPRPTNVLSWPAQDLAAGTDGAMPDRPQPDAFDLTELGDIAISYETCAAEAEAAQKPLGAHVTHLMVHGTLHLLGFDHETDADAARMESFETEILGKMGLADPYMV